MLLCLRTTIVTIIFFQVANAQTTQAFADSIRKVYHIPEIGYAVVSATAVLEMEVLGVKKINTSIIATPTDKFRIGSNTKAITGFIAAQLVKEQKIQWSTKFFDLFPELKANSHKAYHQLTLLNLLTFRTRLYPYTYTYNQPTKDQFSGNEDEQRRQFVKWFLQHEPVATKDSINFSNLGYVAAAQMLEKVSGKSYKELVTDLGKKLGIQFGFGPPNATDSLQPWGHDKDLIPEGPADNYKLNWLLPAGNINASLPDYAKFIQLQLQGLAGQSQLLTKEEFSFLHFGLTKFSVGWFWNNTAKNERYSYNVGNPGTFLSKVFIFTSSNKAYIIFANAQTTDADKGIDVLLEELQRKYE